MRLDRRGHLATVDVRGADLDIITVGYHQNLIQFHAGAFLGLDFFNFKGRTLGNPILLAPGLDNRVHDGESPWI